MGVQLNGYLFDDQQTSWTVSNNSQALDGVTEATAPHDVVVLEAAVFTQQAYDMGTFVGRYLTIHRTVRRLAGGPA